MVDVTCGTSPFRIIAGRPGTNGAGAVVGMGELGVWAGRSASLLFAGGAGATTSVEAVVSGGASTGALQ